MKSPLLPLLLAYLDQLYLKQDPARRPRPTPPRPPPTTTMPDPTDLVAVTRKGILILITSQRLGVTTDGTPHPTDTRRAIILGHFATDFLASGRSFHQWVKDRGYHSPVSPTAEAVFQEAVIAK